MAVVLFFFYFYNKITKFIIISIFKFLVVFLIYNIQRIVTFSHELSEEIHKVKN